MVITRCVLLRSVAVIFTKRNRMEIAMCGLLRPNQFSSPRSGFFRPRHVFRVFRVRQQACRILLFIVGTLQHPTMPPPPLRLHPYNAHNSYPIFRTKAERKDSKRGQGGGGGRGNRHGRERERESSEGGGGEEGGDRKEERSKAGRTPTHPKKLRGGHVRSVSAHSGGCSKPGWWKEPPKRLQDCTQKPGES